MAFREYKIGARMFAFCFGGSMAITLLMPSFTLANATTSDVGLDKSFYSGNQSGFSWKDPLLKGWNKPLKITLNVDPKTKQAMEPKTVYVYKAGTSFPSTVRHTRNFGKGVEELSVQQGKIGEANTAVGAVFMFAKGTFQGKEYSYVDNLTATKGWTPADVMGVADDKDILHAGAGKTMFVREGCWWCHTLLPEETQDWQVFGAPPMLGDFVAESPTAFGSDRKGPDLLHVGSRNSSREWMMLHFFNPRLVQPHSIMPRFDYLWGKTDANGQKIDFDKWRAEYIEYREGKRVSPPDVPAYRKDSEIRYLIDFVMSLK